MKKNILIVALAFTLASYSQSRLFPNVVEYFTISSSIDPIASYNDGLIDIVGELEYVGLIYAKVGFEYFPALEPSYLDIHGGVGVNVVFDKFTVLEDVRLYSGIRLGRIFRENLSRGELIGFEAGIDYNVSENFFVGARGTRDYRNDGVALGWDPFYRNSGYIRLGYKWNFKK